METRLISKTDIANGDKVDLQDCKVTEFYADAKAFFIAACKYLKKKLPFQDEVLTHAEITYTALQLGSRSSSLHYFLKRFPCPLPSGASGEDLLLEFATFQPTDITACKEERPDETWKAIGELNAENGTVLLKFLPSFMLSVGRFSETGLHKWMPFVIFRKTWHSDVDISELGFFYAFIFEWKKSKPVGYARTLYSQTGKNMKWAETFVWCLLLIFKVVHRDHLTQLLLFAWDFIAKR